MTHATVGVIIQNIFNKEQDIKAKIERKPNWTIIGTVCIVVACLFFLPFIGTICLAALMAFLWLPVYKKLSKHLSNNISSVIVYIISSLVIIIPIAILSISAFSQLVNLSKTLAGVNFDSETFTRIINGSAVSNINNLLAPLGNNSFINADSLADFFNKFLPLTINLITKSITNFLSSIPHIFTSVIVYTFIFLAILKHNESLQQYIRNISPFDEDISNKYINRSGLIVAASLRGQFIISFVTAISSAILLSIAFGMMQFFVLFVFVFTILGMVPLGSGIAVIPIIIIQMVIGNTWPGIWSLVIYLGLICNLDTVMRPHLIPKKANVIPAITTLATFCGLYYFGTIGIIYGPLIVILLLTTSDIFISTRNDRERIDNSSDIATAK